MLRGKKLFFGWIVCLLPIGLAACMLSPKPSHEDIVGLWVERRESPSTADLTPHASFNFSADGRFEATDLPREYFTFPGPRISSVSGSWQLDISSPDPFAFHRVNLVFDRSRDSYAFESNLFVSTDGHGYILFAWYGDESNRITFTKGQGKTP